MTSDIYVTKVHTDVQLLNKVSHLLKSFISAVVGRLLLGLLKYIQWIYVCMRASASVCSSPYSLVFLLGFAEEFQDVDRPRLGEPVHPVMFRPLW